MPLGPRLRQFLAVPTTLALAALMAITSVGPVRAADPAPAADTAPDPAAGPLAGVDKVTAIHRQGQTFLVWPERTAIRGETYAIYRSASRITAANLNAARLLGVVGEHSSRVWSERRRSKDRGWTWRDIRQTVIPVRGTLASTTGLLVWTPSAQEDAAAPGGAHYAVVVRHGSRRSAPVDTGRVREQVRDPRPLEVRRIPGRAHVFLQYMDLHAWNPTWDAPTHQNGWLGYERDDPGVRHALSVAYAYVVAEPNPRNCPGDRVPDVLPLVLELHGLGGHRSPPDLGHSDWCALELRPIDNNVSRWFGFAQDHDYRVDRYPDRGEKIANYTEMRVLRMIKDLLAGGGLGARVDRQRIYVWGGSMGATGALSFALRYPTVFAAAHARSPIPDYGAPTQSKRTEVASAWGRAELDLPMVVLDSTPWGASLEPYEGTGVWTWQDAITQARALRDRDSVPLGFAHGTLDLVSPIRTQGAPLYAAMDAAKRTFGTSFRVANHRLQGFIGLLPTLGLRNGVPFYGLRAVLGETVPGLSDDSLAPKLPPRDAAELNTGIEWSASWDDWDGAPIDQPDRWRMSFRSTDDRVHRVDITPRRLQAFRVDGAHGYHWTLRDVATDEVLDEGDVLPDKAGLLTVRIRVDPDGTRLTIEATEPPPGRRRARR